MRATNTCMEELRLQFLTALSRRLCFPFVFGLESLVCLLNLSKAFQRFEGKKKKHWMLFEKRAYSSICKYSDCTSKILALCNY